MLFLTNIFTNCREWRHRQPIGLVSLWSVVYLTTVMLRLTSRVSHVFCSLVMLGDRRLKPFGHRFGWQQAEKEVRARARLEAANTTGVGAPPGVCAV